MEDRPLPPRQRALLICVSDLSERHGYAPSLVELADALSPPVRWQTVQEWIKALKRKGLVSNVYGVCRSLRITPEGRKVLALIQAQAQSPAANEDVELPAGPVQSDPED